MEEPIEFSQQKFELSHYVQAFVATVSVLKIPVFLTDPFLMYRMIGDKHKKSLIEKQLITESITNSNNSYEFCLSFGVFKHNIDSLVSYHRNYSFD